VAKVGTSNPDRKISLKAAVRSCINKQVNSLVVEVAVSPETSVYTRPPTVYLFVIQDVNG